MGNASASAAEADINSAKSKFDEAELIEAELLFAQMQALSAKTDGLDKPAFLSHFPLPGMLGDRLFFVFDFKNDNVIDFEEFLCGLSVCCRSPMEQKLHFFHQMFDLDGDGIITAGELQSMLVSMLTHAFNESNTEIVDGVENLEDGQPLAIATRLVQAAFAGASSSSELSFEEFRRWLVESQLFLVVWQNVFDPYEASGFRSPMEVPVFVPALTESM